MEILGTEFFGESINIHPVTRTRAMENPPYPKSILKSGDTVLVRDTKSGLGLKFVYVSKDDYIKYKFDNIFDWMVSDYIDNDGIFIAYFSDEKMYKYMMLDSLDRNLLPVKSLRNKAMKYVPYKILRNAEIGIPFGKDYAKNPKTEGEGVSTVWTRCAVSENIAHGQVCVNESVNIRPVTKTRLSASVPRLYNSGEEMRSNLQSGDIVIRETSDGSVSQPSVYIKIEDWKKYGYAKALGMHSVTNTAIGGVFVTYDGGKCKFGWTSVWNYNKYLESKTKFLDFKVTEIYRPLDFKQPAYIEYLKNPTNYNASLIWRRDKAVDESIAIHPVTKKRLLGNDLLMYTSSSDMYENLESGDLLIVQKTERNAGKTKDAFQQKGVYVSFSDFVNNYMEQFGFNEHTLKLIEEHRCGIVVFYHEDEKVFRYTKIDTYGKRLHFGWMSTNALVTSVFRCNTIKSPLPIDYFKNPPLTVMHAVWKRDGRLDESIDIAPVTKTRLGNGVLTVREYSLQRKLDNAEVKPIPLFKDGDYKYDREITLKLSENDLETLNRFILDAIDESDYLTKNMLSEYCPLPFGMVKLNYTMQYLLLNIAMRNKHTKFNIDTSHLHILKIEKQ